MTNVVNDLQLCIEVPTISATLFIKIKPMCCLGSYNNIISKNGNTQLNVIIIKYLNTGTGLNDVPLT